jgi:2-oxoglutarate ferredoxin oxidoreductase subunit beta
MFEPWMNDPNRTLLVQHERGLKISSALARIYENQQTHDPLDLNEAREIASSIDPIPVGILYHNPEVPCYEEVRNAGQLRTTELIQEGLNTELDKFTVWPQEADAEMSPAA